MGDKPETILHGGAANKRRVTEDKITKLKYGHNMSNNRTNPVKDDLFSFVDSNLRWIRYGVYGAGVVGVVLIVRATRSTQVFRKISDIPESYISRNLTLQGVVEQVGPDCSLYLKHKPILTIPSFLKSESGQGSEAHLLPIHLAGIEPSPRGRTWLINQIKGQHVWFRLLEKSRHPPRLDCLVTIKQRFLSRTVINEELIRLGVCRLKDFPSPPTSPGYSRVIDKLVAVEARAERRKMSRIRRITDTIRDLGSSVASVPRRIKSFVSKFRRK